jgi:hypothetical protein
MNRHKNFIRDAYDGKINGQLCNEWKQAIEKHYPEFKETLEVGKWYTNEYGHIISLTKVDDGDVEFYGFYTNGWSDKDYADVPLWIEKLKPANEEEVKTALINEAKRRGFKKGVRATWAFQKNTNEALEKDVDDLFFHINDGAMLTDGFGHSVFSDGKWAEIIKETITKEEAEKLLGKTIIL